MGDLHHHYPLARHTSWRVGGAADCAYRPDNLQDLQHFLQQLPPDEPLTWLGLGSNVLIRDGGIAGTVILTLNRLNEIYLLNGQQVYAEAGVTCAKLAKFCIKNGFEEGAFFAGIPGTVGGALAMNAGAFGGETWQYVDAVEMLSRSGQLTRQSAKKFTVAYRKVKIPPSQFFAAGIFRFKKGDAQEAEKNLKALLKKRNASQPIGTYSCGSVFRNPPGNYAARLIEQAGLKGYTLGNACVSQKHANFILNTGNATALELENLVNYVKVKVIESAGIELIPEVHVIGRK